MNTDHALVLVRERSHLELLDLTLTVWRSKFKTLAVAASIGIIPCELFNLALWSNLGWTEADGSPAWLPWLFIVAVEAPLATTVLTQVLGRLMFGQRIHVSEIARVLARSLPALLLYHILMRGLLIASLFMCWVIPLRMGFVNEVLLLERSSWRSVLGRCAILAGDRGAELVGRFLFELILGLLFVTAWTVSLTRLQSLLLSDFSWTTLEPPELLGWRARLGVWIAVAFFAVARFLTYIDQRIRLEGWEIELRLKSVGSRLDRDQAE